MKHYSIRFVALLATLFLLVPMGAQAFDAYIGGLCYNLSGSEATVTYEDDNFADRFSDPVTIPSSVTYNGKTYSVTSIGEYAFRGCYSLPSITIPNSVTSIGYKAFRDCSGLTKAEFASIESLCAISFDTWESNPLYNAHHLYIDGKEVKNLVIPNSVTSIGEYAFCGCSGLTSVTIPNSVTSIGNSAFLECSGLTSVTIPNSVTSIGENAFCGCSGLTSVTIPNSVTSIGNSAFLECSGLTSVTIPNSVTSIGEGAFWACYNLIYENYNGAYYLGNADSPYFALIDGYGVSGSYNIKAGCKLIADAAFSYNESLTSINIPNTVTTIGNNAFEGCTNLTSIRIPTSLNRVKPGAFNGCTSLSKVIVTDIAAWCGIIYEGDNWEGDFPMGRAHHLYSDEDTEITEVVIPNGVTRIEPRAFRDAQFVTSVTIPNSVRYIGSDAFRGMLHLTSINLPNGITSIESCTFDDCQTLPTVTIPSGVTSIGHRAFYNCGSLASVNIPEGVTKIDSEALHSCSSLTSITIPESMDSLEVSAFYGCSSLTSVTIPNVLTYVGPYAFAWCTGLTDVTIGSGVTSIEFGAFEDCSSLTSVTVKNPTPVAIADNVFSNRANATLYVPYGSKAAYKAADYWKEFNEIVEAANPNPEPEVTKGDLNDDGKVSITDVVMIIDVMAGTITDANKVAAADVNGDGNVSITDCVAAIDLIAADYGGETPDGHAWVDLGLPSGTLWATCNVGASSPEEYGDYFAWGETEPKSDYSWSTYKYCEGSNKTMTKYCTQSSYGYNGFTDNLTELQPEDDAATANWGSDWQMPSREQIQELWNSSYTTTEWTQVNGVYGRKITSNSNGNSIFLPADGYRDDTSLNEAGSGGGGWSRSLYTSNRAYYLYFHSYNIDCFYNYRYLGLSVRPVRRLQMNSNGMVTAGVSAPQSAKRKTHAMLSDTDFISAAMQENVLNISLDNERHYTAFQMTVSMPEGMTLGRATMDKMRGADHLVTVRDLGRGHYLVAGFSADNEELMGNSGCLLSIITEGQAAEDIIISDIEFATTQAEAYHLADVAVSGTPTGINEMKNEEMVDGKWYDLLGRRVTKTTKGIYIHNGKKIIIK